MALTDVSIIGFSVICDNKIGWFRRCLWFVLVVLGVGLCFYQLRNIASLYFSRPVRVNVEYSDNIELGVRFPVVTICPWRRFSKVWLQENGLLDTYTNHYVQLDDFISGGNMSNGGDHSTINNDKVTEGLDFVLNQSFDNTFLSRHCTFKQKQCDSSISDGGLKLNRLYNEAGACMSFEATSNSKSAGQMAGYNIILDTYDTDSFRSLSMWGNGYKVIIHGPSTVPTRESHGVVVGGGFQTNLAIKKTTYLRLPGSNGCVQVAEGSDYSYDRCLEGCISEDQLKKCNCTEAFMAQSREFPCNTVAMKACALRQRSQMLAHGKKRAKKCSLCYRPCEHSEYDVSASMMPLSQDTVSRNLGPNVSSSSVLALSVYLSTLDTLQITQDIAYDEWSLMSDIGGALSLLLGATLYSIIEIVEEAYTCIARKQGNKRRRSLVSNK